MMIWTRLNYNRFAGTWELHAERWSRAQLAAVDEHEAVLFHLLDERADGVVLIVVLDAASEREAARAAWWLAEDVGDGLAETPLAWKWERAIGDALGTRTGSRNEWRRAG